MKMNTYRVMTDPTTRKPSPPDDTVSEPVDCEAVYRDARAPLIRFLQGGFCFRSASGQMHRWRAPSAQDSEELCQEAFARFLFNCRRGRFDARRPVMPYLRRIAINVALERLRQRGREISLDAWNGSERHATAPSASPAAQAERRSLSRRLGAFHRVLGDRERIVFDACFGGEATQAEAGARLGLSRDQVYRSLVRIRRLAEGWFPVEAATCAAQ